MPIYEYQCSNCGRRTEVFQKFSDPPPETCELCNGRVKKLISQSSFHLKGTGWYVTDYANQGKNTEKAAAGPSKDSSEKTATKEPASSADKGGKSE
jgi:putative FmdB family regulatory protein